MAIRVYTSKHCAPCKTVERLIKEGRFEGEIELIDIETDEGFQQFKDEVLEFSDGAVPSAYKEGNKCAIRIDEENDLLVLDCPIDPPSESETS